MTLMFLFEERGRVTGSVNEIKWEVLGKDEEGRTRY